MTALYFQNPSNGYEEKVSYVGLFCLLFGFLYFVVKGIWTHALLGLVLAGMTCGISWLIYPFFARGIVERYYLRRGWVPVIK